MPHAVREPHAAHSTRAAAPVAEATLRLRERRHAQAGRPTFGDEADAALLAALRALPAEELALAHEALRQAGDVLGRDVLARRCYEDSLAGAVAILSTTTLASGWGTFAVEAWFHRRGIVAFAPLPAARDATLAFDPFVAGLLEGYLGEAFNCAARAEPLGRGRFETSLLEGRDVNARRWTA